MALGARGGSMGDNFKSNKTVGPVGKRLGRLTEADPLAREWSSSFSASQRGSLSDSAVKPLKSHRRQAPAAIRPEELPAPTQRQSVVADPLVRHDITTAPTTPITAPTPDAKESNQFGFVALSKDWVRRRGHWLTFIALINFTIVLYIRPADWWSPNWPLSGFINSIAFYTGSLLLALFLPMQFIADGNLSARPREVYYVLLLLLAGFLSIPLADQDRFTAKDTFNDTFVRAILVFIVMVNIVRTEKRLRIIMFVPWAVGLFLAYRAFNDYLTGNFFAFEEGRVGGFLGGMFGNPNDLSQHFVMMIPLTVAFILMSPRGLKDFNSGTNPPPFSATAAFTLMIPRLVRRLVLIGCLVLLLLGEMVTFSRGGFLGTATVTLVMTWKFSKKHRMLLMSAVLVIFLGLLAAAPGSYRNRVLAIVDDSYEANAGKGSAKSRSFLLNESIKVALRHPVLGVGMGNFRLIYKLQTHNAYTEVAAEMGMMGFLAYLFFIIAPLKRLREIEKATYNTPDKRRFYYLAVCLQASLAGYMVSSFFGAIAYFFFIYYLVGFGVSFRMIYYHTVGLPVDTLKLPEPEETPAKTTPLLRPA